MSTAAGVGLAIVLAGAALSAPVVGRAGGWEAWLFLAIALSGFALAGIVAGRLRDDTPVLHGALGAATAYLVALVVGLVIVSIADRAISLVAIPVGAVAAVTAGVAGALVADGVHRRLRHHPARSR